MSLDSTDNRVTVVAGNPKPQSRTLAAAVALAIKLTGREPDSVIDVVTLGPGLLGWGDPAVAQAVDTISTSDLVIFASPTYKATYTGILKLLLDHIGGGSLERVTAVALMLGAGPHHALAPELLLKPVLAELGASCPTAALYLLDSDTELAGAEKWLATAKVQLRPELLR